LLSITTEETKFRLIFWDVKAMYLDSPKIGV
jgi:hypothetical protein